MIERHKVNNTNIKCSLCNKKQNLKALVLRRVETQKFVCMSCLIEICERTNETEIKDMPKDPSLENVKCPLCKGPMTSRKNAKTGSRFWGCNNYPVCKGTRDSMGMSRQDRINEAAENDWPTDPRGDI